MTLHVLVTQTPVFCVLATIDHVIATGRMARVPIVAWEPKVIGARAVNRMWTTRPTAHVVILSSLVWLLVPKAAEVSSL